MYHKQYSVQCCIRIWQLNGVYIQNILFCITPICETIENWILSLFLPQSNWVRLDKSFRSTKLVINFAFFIL